MLSKEAFHLRLLPQETDVSISIYLFGGECILCMTLKKARILPCVQILHSSNERDILESTQFQVVM